MDRYPASGGSEGDPVNLAVTRTANFWNRKIVLCSTPTVKGASRIEAAWLESNQQSYWVPCPHCGAHQVLRRANGVRHEALDACVYAYAALRALVSTGLVLDAKADRIQHANRIGFGLNHQLCLG